MPSTTSKNLGQVAATLSSSTPPTNTNVVWLDTSGASTIKKLWDPIGLAWIPLTQSATVAGDNWGTQVAIVDTTLEGTGVTGTPLKISQQGATSGQILKWNGTTWLPANETTGGLTAVASDATLDGDGSVGAPLQVAQQGATTGQVLTLNGTTWVPTAPNSSASIQKGMIFMWAGTIAQIPAGYFLCDGTNGTPNMSGKFVVGYDVLDGDYNTIGNAGGLKTVSLNGLQNGPHTHGITDNGHAHSIIASGIAKSGNTTSPVWVVDNGSDVNVGGSQTFTNKIGTATTGISIQASGTGTAHENRPPYFTLAFIQKS